MEWIKRNLILALSGVVTLALLGGGGAYLYSRLNAKAEAETAVQARLQTLTQLEGKPPAPTLDNIRTIEQDRIKLTNFVQGLVRYYQAGPAEKLEANEFKTQLLLTLAQLRQEAQMSRVTVQTNYNFAFSLFLPILQFDNSAIGMLYHQLNDVKGLCKVLFDSRIYELIEIRRAPASTNDTANWGNYPNEYLSEKRISTNEMAVVYPYMVTFRSSTAELGAVLDRLIHAPTGFIVKNVKAVPAEAVIDTGAAVAAMQAMNSGYPSMGDMSGGYPYGGMGPMGAMGPMGPMGRRYPQRIYAPTPAPVQIPAPVMGSRRPPAQSMFLQEKPLKITLWVNAVRLKDAPPAK